ncbi:hypothetical protein [Streptomyces avermitilis]|uniref:hypothetical protein n=1 Tax=Streptomyces avermitilis TaxID=33903 RepID=UPI003814CA31
MASAPCEAAVQVLAQAASPKRPPGVAEADADPLVGGVLGQVELLGQESLQPVGELDALAAEPGCPAWKIGPCRPRAGRVGTGREAGPFT